MKYLQLVDPDLSATGRIGYCLEYAAHVFGYYGPGTNAWDAWNATQHKHVDALPTDVAVPVWFSYIVNGINLGHVVISVPGQGFYSSPWKQGTNHAVLPSIAEVERIYGVKYVGWSEDILGEQVIEGGNMPTIADADHVDSLAHAYLNDSIAANPGLKEYVGKPIEDVIAVFNGAPERDAYLKHIQDLETGLVTKSSVLAYINKNLQ